MYALIFGSIIHKGLTFLPSLYQKKYLKTFLPKGTLLDTTILSTFSPYIKTEFLCWQNLYFLTSLLPNVINFFTNFICGNKFL